jgi:hypothetical protein
VLRGFVVPRGITILAGGFTEADARRFTMTAALVGDDQYRVAEGQYLGQRASTTRYEVTVTLHDDDTWSYAERSMLRMKELPEPFGHTDRNTLHRVTAPPTA